MGDNIANAQQKEHQYPPPYHVWNS